MSIKESALDILFPPKCAFCGKMIAHTGDGVCDTCKASLPFREEGKTLLRLEGFDCAVTFYYDGAAKEGIHALKFEGRSNRAAVFGRYLAQTAAEELGGQFDAVTFVPISPWRNFCRGYDQARLLAEAAGAVWGVKAEKTLRKVRNNRPQSSVKSPEERRANVLDVYRPLPGAELRGRRFLLIDDVATTGSTLASCAKALLSAGASSVVCAALAGGHQAENAAPADDSTQPR